MPRNIVLEEQELIELEQGGGLSRHTESTRAKQYKDFDDYDMSKNVLGVKISRLLCQKMWSLGALKQL